MKKFIKPAVCTLSVLSLSATLLVAADKSGSKNGQLSERDAQFLQDAANGGLTEVKAGELAITHGSSQTVKQFGRQMVEDHGQANEKLKAIAAQKGVTLPTKPEEKEQKTLDRLQQLSGTAFDKAYAKDMVDDHQKDVKEFQNAAKNLDDPDLKKFATDTTPVLEHHLQMAKDMQADVKGK